MPRKQLPPVFLAERLARLEKLATWMDARWHIPGTRIPFGLDGLIGLLPVVGDTLTALIAGWVIKEAHALGLPFHLKLRMVWNIFVDWLVGLVPIIGDYLDIRWKANRKNVAIIRRYFHPHDPHPPQ